MILKGILDKGTLHIYEVRMELEFLHAFGSGDKMCELSLLWMLCSMVGIASDLLLPTSRLFHADVPIQGPSQTMGRIILEEHPIIIFLIKEESSSDTSYN